MKQIHHLIRYLIWLPGIFLTCLIGATAAVMGWQKLEAWCERQLDQ